MPTLPAVTLRLPAVMSTLSLAPSPSSSAPATFRLTLCTPAFNPPTVKSPLLTLKVTAPLAAAVCTATLPPALKFNTPVVALLSVSALASLR